MFIPNTEAERNEMLQKVGLSKIEDLFSDVPKEFRYPDLNLPEAVSEMEALQNLKDLAIANDSTEDLICFLGAGAYNHYIPAAVDAIISRGEFLTSYTPYQPEVSQGTLQAIFEYQSLVASLTGMDVSNASHYDGATSAAEACVLAYHHFRGKRTKFVLSRYLHPHYRETIKTYFQGYEDIHIMGDQVEDGMQTREDLLKLVDYDTAIVYVQYPDFLGRVQDFKAFAEQVHAFGAILAVSVNPLALGLIKPPSEFDADIVTGEGQPLGIPLSYGGPYLGIFTTKNEFIRKLSGRLVGETVDNEGKRGYVLTLTAREQHIRRSRATSNICTNQGIIALTSAVYMSLLGKQGLKKVAKLNYDKAHYAADQISKLKGFELVNLGSFFNEFVVRTPIPVNELNLLLLDYDILGGYDLSTDYPELKNHMLLAVTEMNTKDDIGYLVETLQEVTND
ncbi:MAG: aminomethyl-transferring glycine dehydrogenase subunit GcvPA [Anaerolineaceae bacterium]|jgi:glycine dehydrogenase subunit 1|nr:aminomethyl-transferring glycine dehydrogenase subunit GcvPA [Anaerolineaceae bacterium]